MNIHLFLSCVLALLCGACTTAGNVENRTGRLLCIEKTVSNETINDCLSALNASPEEVERRVALYNDDKSPDRKIHCRQRKALGSNLSKWRCFRANRSGDESEIPLGALELLRKSTNR